MGMKVENGIKFVRRFFWFGPWVAIEGDMDGRYEWPKKFRNTIVKGGRFRFNGYPINNKWRAR